MPKPKTAPFLRKAVRPYTGPGLSGIRGVPYRPQTFSPLVGFTMSDIERSVDKYLSGLTSDDLAIAEMKALISDGIRYDMKNGTGQRRNFMREALLNYLRHLRAVTLKCFRLTVATWKQQPVFKGHDIHATRGGDMGFVVGTDDELYAILNAGTRRTQDIVPVRRKALRFFIPFAPKTKPGAVKPTMGGRGKQAIITKRVRGVNNRVAPRHWDTTIAEAIRKVFEESVGERMALAYEFAKAGGFYETRRIHPEQSRQISPISPRRMTEEEFLNAVAALSEEERPYAQGMMEIISSLKEKRESGYVPRNRKLKF